MHKKILSQKTDTKNECKAFWCFYGAIASIAGRNVKSVKCRNPLQILAILTLLLIFYDTHGFSKKLVEHFLKKTEKSSACRIFPMFFRLHPFYLPMLFHCFSRYDTPKKSKSF